MGDKNKKKNMVGVILNDNQMEKLDLMCKKFNLTRSDVLRLMFEQVEDISITINKKGEKNEQD